MGRLVGFVVATAFLVAAAAPARASTVLPAPASVGAALMLRLFGEVSDARASFSASSGDVAGESPLRDAAFRVSIAAMPQSTPALLVAPDDAALAKLVTVGRLARVRPVDRTAVENPGTFAHVGASMQPARHMVARTPMPMLVTAEYQPAPTTLDDGANDSNAFAFGGQRSEPMSGSPTQTFSFQNDSALGSQAQSVQLPLALRVGNLHLQARLGAAQLTSANADNAENLPVYIPPYAGVSRASLGATLALPVAPRLLLGFGYNTEHLLGGYDMPDGLDARNDTYSGGLTFLFPRLSSAISLSAQQYRYQDNLVPTNTYTELREGLNLTVKF